MGNINDDLQHNKARQTNNLERKKGGKEYGKSQSTTNWTEVSHTKFAS